VKRIFLSILFITLVLTSVSAPGTRDKSYRIRTIVIDAGHGGHDAGCLGASSREKHVALGIALRLGKMIESGYPDIKVVYTRKTDVFIPLHERANIANKANADLFICIHLNSGSKSAYGSETYVMGTHKAEDNLAVAKRENEVITLEDNYRAQYDGFDPNSPEANIIFTLYQSQFMAQSIQFATHIQHEFTHHAGRHNRGVKQAGFLVLYKTAMPAVLIECGFLSHDDEERFLASDKGQQLMATSIFRAVKRYKADMESDKPDALTESQLSTGTAASTSTSSTTDQATGNQETKIQNDAPDKKEIPDTVRTTVSNPASTTPITGTKKTEIFLTVQIGATKDPVKDQGKYLKTPDAKAILCPDGFTRYVVGQFTSEQAARSKLQSIKSSHWPDAFLVGFIGNEKVPYAEALSKLNKQQPSN
jgi:N-acetylmuramoyl-L-alanine amidase